LCCTGAGSAFALDPAKRITQFGHDVWQTREGLPQNSVQAVVQTRDGYLWFGTQEGLARFDGVQFTVFDSRNTPGIRNHFIWSLFEDRDGVLWIGTTGGLLRYRDRRFQTLTTQDGLSSNVVRVITQDHDGRLWIGTGNGLSVLEHGVLKTALEPKDLGHNIVRGLRVALDGSLWITTSGGGVARLDHGVLQRYTVADGLPSDFAWPILEDHLGRIWVGTDQGLAQFRNGRFSEVPGPPSLHVFVRSIYEDHDGTLWVGTSSGLHRFTENGIEVYTPSDGLSDGEVLSLLEDREGSLWVGTLGGGLNRFKDGKFTTLSRQEGLAHDFVRSIYQDPHGSIWISTWGGGLNQYRDGRFRTWTTRQGLASDLVWPLLMDASGALWVGTGSGLNKLVHDRVVATYTVKHGLKSDLIRSLYLDRSGTLWVGTDGGVSRFEKGRFTTYTIQEGLTNDTVFAMFEDKDGGLWVATRAGLNLLKDGRAQDFPFRAALAGDFIKSFYQDEDGALYIGTGTSGLKIIRQGRLTSVGRLQGLNDDVVHQILPDGRGHLWFSSNKGVSYVTLKELADFSAGRIPSVHAVAFGTADGMRSAECNTGSPAGWRMADGRLWFPTIKGIAIIDPARLTVHPQPPPLMIEKAVMDGTELDLLQPSRSLAPGPGNLEIRYAGLSYLSPERVRFKYMLVGFDKEWVDAGGRRTAYYTNLPPGSYTFRVTASNGDDLWNQTTADLAFRLQPRYYQTVWFYLLGALFLVGLIRFVYVRRTRALRRREREVAAMEEALSRRVHAEQELVRSEARYRSLVQSALLGIFRSTYDGRFLEVNPALVQMLGYDSAEELMAVDIARNLYADPQERLRILDRLTGRDTIESMELDLRRKDGSPVILRVTGRCVRDAAGHIESFEMIAENVTERKALEEQLRQSQRMDAIGRLAGGIAHDFNNLLTVILGYGDILLGQFEKSDSRYHEVAEVKKAASRAADLTQQLLAFSRRQVLAPKVLDLNRVVTEMEKMLRRLLLENIELVTDVAASVAPIKADPGQIEQVIMNLVVNARDAMPAGGRLVLRTASVSVDDEIDEDHFALPAGDYVQLTVTDSGIGMAPEVVSRIFEPFFTTKDAGKGTGLGLATVYGIVKQSGGHITVKSQPGQGSTFTVYLPAVHELSPEPSDTQRAFLHRDGQQATILVVEDEEGVRLLISEVLRKAGYSVLTASGPEEALRLCHQSPGTIDLLLTDVVLGQLNGFDLAEQLAPFLRSPRVVFMSGYTEDHIAQKNLGLPGTAFLHKPFAAAALTSTIREVLELALDHQLRPASPA
jgi:PAS domain S-box-containing protein